MKGKHISKGFWDEAVRTIVNLNNMSPTTILGHKNPFESLYGYKPKLGHIRVFGIEAFSHVSKDDRRKLDAKSIKCIFIGYCDDHKAYKMFDPSMHKVFPSRDVIFHENTDECTRVDNNDTWCIPYENIMEDANENVE